MTATSPFIWTDATVRRALGLDLEGGEPTTAGAGARHYTGVSTDTRRSAPGNLFVALRGPRFDGHRFMAQAAASGATGAVVDGGTPDLDTESLPAGFTLYRVPDTLVALGQLGRFRRRAFPGPVVGLTGSSGKTTVKEMLRAALSARFRVHATPANENNRVGVPLTLLAVPGDAEVMVVEMGTNEPGEIALLTRITEPDVGIVITVSESHLEGLGSLEGVLAEKLSLVDGLAPEARSFVGDSPPELPRAARRIREDVDVVGFTADADSHCRARGAGMDAEGRMTFHFGDLAVRPAYPGRHGATNALMALAVARELGVPVQEAAAEVEGVRPGGLRGEVLRVGTMELILDCYNANPQSVRAALDTLGARRRPGRKIAVLGSMLELGGASAALHREVLTYALGAGVDRVVAVGAFAEAARELAGSGRDVSGLLVVPDPAQVPVRLFPLLDGNELVLLKGSRGVRMESLVPHFEEAFGTHVPEAGGPTNGASGTGGVA
ncbi:MAG: UDP-N-acetylmuramoyl-tripeptide--D-alanyl-D-alanine ligase [Gemmatimonadales bacterium]|nr:MAG: UDP-N-acetylmuramoyl-tripeptide--D-alanyl-D-alanine ligase [Gemmatimonadales bacterium]